MSESTPKSKESAAPLVDANGLKEILSAALTAAQQNNEGNIAQLVAALLESKKPYVDTRQEENLRMIAQQDAAARERQRAAIEDSQKSCPHFQGSNPLSEIPGQLTSIVQHRLDTGEVIGICTNCLRVWRRGDEDYAKQMNRKSGNRLSMSGIRHTYNPIHAA